MTNTEIARMTSKDCAKKFGEMLVAIGDSLSDLASSDDGEDGEAEDDDETEQGKLSQDDKPGWAMDTIMKTVKQWMEKFWQKQMMLDQLTQLGWEDAANYFCERDTKYGTSELSVPAVVQLQTNEDAPAPPLTTFGELMKSLHIVPGISQWTSRPGCSHNRLGSVKPQSKTSIPSCEPAAEPYLSMLLKAKPVEPVTFTPPYSLQLITI